MRAPWCVLCALLLCGGSLWAQDERAADTATPWPTSVAPLPLDPAAFGQDRAVCCGDKDVDGVSTTPWNLPLRTTSRTARTTSLYLASELACTGGQINGIKYYVTSTPTGGFMMHNLTIRLKHTTATTLTSTTFDNAGWTIAYQADTQITTTGWVPLTFTTPFTYDSLGGTQNLLLDVSFANPSAATADYNVYSYTTTGNRSLFKYCAACDCGGSTDPLQWTTCAGVTLIAKLARVQFVFPPCGAGACCVNYVCTTHTQAECAALSGTWFGGENCTTFFCPPVNDDCSNVQPVTLTDGVPVTFTGDNRGATYDPNDCTSFPGGQVWHAFTLPASDAAWDVTLDYCETISPFGSVWLNCALGCPCTGLSPVATPSDCNDGNAQLRWAGLPAGTYYYPVRLDPANNSAGPYVLHVVGTPSYCAGNSSLCDEYISRVQVNTIDDPSGCTPGGYADYTAQSTFMVLGVSSPITVQNGVGYSADQCGIWVDWNNDRDFSDPNEQITVLGTPGPGPYTANITPPPGTPLGAVRLRLRIMYTGPLSPCGTTDSGEVEDYTIQVVNAFGACCQADGACAVTSEAECGGNWLGLGTTCLPDNPCLQPNVACCFGSGDCQMKTAADCTLALGTPGALGSTCTPNTCLQPDVACCFGSGDCQMKTAADCTLALGTPGALGSTCTPNTCPQPLGACCFATAPCAQLTEAACTSQGGGWQADKPCEPDPCASSGVCHGDMNCDNLVSFRDINAFVLYLSSFSAWQTSFHCAPANGDLNGDGTYPSFKDINSFVVKLSSTTLPIACPQQSSGACCLLDGSCVVSTQGDCLGTWHGESASCTPSPCPPQTGACCAAGGCTTDTEPACLAQSGVYKGNGSTCSPNSCICTGDLNCDGKVNFKDINPFVVYLSNSSAWHATFPGCPTLDGDINADGTYPSFKDINPFVVLLGSTTLPINCRY